MAMTKQQFLDLNDARFREIFDDKYQGFDTYYEKILKIENSGRSYEQYSSVSGHTLLQEKSETANTETDARIQGYDITFSNRTFSLDAEISYEAMEDDQYNILKGESEQLAKIAKRTPDVHVADVFNRGFQTTDSYGNSQLAADGIRYFSTLHKKNPDESGTTYSNANASGIPLSDDNIETGIRAMEEQKNPRGILAGARARVLLVPPALRKTALIITGSDKRAETADNDANVYNGNFESYYGGSLKVIVWDELGASNTRANGSNTAWFLLDPTLHEILFQWREKPRVLPYDFVKKTLKYVYTCVARYEFGMVDYRGVWGSKGDASAYSS